MTILSMTCRLTFPTGSGHGTNTWHFRAPSGLPTDDLIRAGSAGAVEDFYTAASGLFPAGYQIEFDGTALVVDGDDAGDYATAGSGWVVNGGGGANVCPNEAMMVVGWRTASSKRSARGRTFLGPINLVMAEGNGTPTAAALSLLGTAVSGILSYNTGIASPDAAIGVWAGVGHVDAGDDNTFRDYTGGAVRDRFAVLRSRRD